MKRKLTSYLFLTAGVMLAFFLSGCIQGPAPVKPSNHTMYSTVSAVHVSLIGRIADFQFTHFQQTLLYMRDRDIKNLHIHIYTLGGSVVTMIAITDLLESFKREGLHITTYCNGAVMSSGVPIFIMGQDRIMRPNAALMIHPFGNTQGMTKNASTLKALKKLNDRYIDILTKSTKIKKERLKKMMSGDSRLNHNYIFAHEALKLGLATEIR